MQYTDKISSLKELFNTEAITIEPNALNVGTARYPIINGVIIITESNPNTEHDAANVAKTFSREWHAYGEILPEHKKEFEAYTDLLALPTLKQSRICDLGCGSGRWSSFLAPHCRELILVDFSDAIFIARENLKYAKNALFFKCDLKRLPFAQPFADMIICLGVLHHLPTQCLHEVRALKKYAPELLIYLYYNLDNRPWYFRLLLMPVSAARRIASALEHEPTRRLLARLGAYCLYRPMIALGVILNYARRGYVIPLYEAYHGKSMKRIEQDVYDRFFTPIEQRVSRADIIKLRDSFSKVIISNNPPYYHFLCKK